MQSKATSAGVGQRPEMKDGAVKTSPTKSNPLHHHFKTFKKICAHSVVIVRAFLNLQMQY